MKKDLKIFGISVLVLLIILIVAPFLFKDSMEKYMKAEINKNLNATVTWEELDLSLFRSFPNASVGLHKLYVENLAPFQGDTLFYAEQLNLKMGLMQLFKSEGYSLDEVSLNESLIYLKTNKEGQTNWDIAKETDQKEATIATEQESSTSFQLNLKHYELKNSRIVFIDEQGQMSLSLKELNHSGDGDFTSSIFNLRTYTNAKVSFGYDGTNYLTDNYIKLDAELGMDLDQMKFTFLENEATINQLALRFDGFYQMNENDAEMDIKFNTPTSDFKNFLGLIPAAYASSLDGVQTSGNFDIDGRAFGKLDETYIPKLDIKMNSSQASFKYPDLPKKVEDIFMDIQILNNSGLVEDTQVKISDARFRIDQDKFSGKLDLSQLTTNMLVDLDAKGSLNLSKISQVYPVEADLDLIGILTADINAKFDMNSIEKELYQNIQTTGNLLLKDFHYQDEELPNAYDISEASVRFSTNNVQLNKLDLKTGGTDLSATGRLDNLMGFMFSGQALKGRFIATSKNFAISDFMTQTESTSSKQEGDNARNDQPKVTEEAIKIPDFLDIVLDFSADRVLYDNMELTQAKGSMIIKDETAKLKDVSANMFGGSIAINGTVSTKNAQPDFNMKMGLSEVDIAQIFQQMELARTIAPIASALVGKVSTNFDLAGKLTSDFSPVLNSLAGGALAEIDKATVNPEKTQLLSQLNQSLELIDFSKINLDGLSTQATFNDGKINVKPFQFEVEGVDVNVNGSHNFDASMNYALDLKIPANKLGSSLSSQLAKLSGEDVNEMFVNLPVTIGGSFTKPQLQMDMQGAMKKITNQIIDKQRQKLEEEVKGKVEDGILDLLGGKSKDEKATDSTATKNEKDIIEDKVTDILGGLLGKKKKK